MNPQLEPLPWHSIPEMLADTCERFGEHTAIIDGDEQLSYAELASAVDECSRAMSAHGIVAGDRICIWAPNSWQWIVCAFAGWQLGAIIVPISSRLKAMEAGPVLQQSEARILFSVSDCAGSDLPGLLMAAYGGSGEHVFAQIPSLEKVVCFDSTSASYCAETFSEFTAGGGGKPITTAVSGDALGEILFTSGTTGEPKGVMLNQRQVMQAFWDWSGIGGLQAEDRFLVIPPFSHGFGINAGILACVMRAMTHVVVDFFDPEAALDLIRCHRISVMSGPPALFAALADKVTAAGENKNPADTLRVAYVGAAHVPESMIRRMQSELGIDRVINAYGLIEACVVSMTRSDDSNAVISTTVGRALPGVGVRIVDDDGTELPRNKAGEILVQGYGVMQGYFNAPDLSAAAFAEDNCLRTGDMGLMDEAGNLAIVGRKKDMYICNGFNVYPAEVEDLLLQHPTIGQAAVVGVEHSQKGEAGVAFIIPASGLEPGAGFDERSIINWARENMAGYKVPLRILALDSFPLNANGKVVKEQLRELALRQLENESTGA